MRHITTFAISAAALASVAVAEVEASATAGFHTLYIFRGIDFTDTGSNSAENSLFDFGFDVGGSCDCGLDWYAGIWQGRTSDDSPYNETDIYAGVTKDLGFGSVDLGVITYTYDDGTDNDAEIYVGLSTSVAGIDFGSTTSIGVAGAWEDGIWQQFTLGYGIDLNDKTSVGFELATGLAFGNAFYADDIDGFALFQATLSVEHALSDDVTLSPYVSYVTTDDDYTGTTAPGVDLTYEGLIVGASLSFTF